KTSRSLCLRAHQLGNEGSKSSEFSLVLIHCPSTLLECQELTLHFCSIISRVVLFTYQLLKIIPRITLFFTRTHSQVAIPLQTRITRPLDLCTENSITIRTVHDLENHFKALDPFVNNSRISLARKFLWM
ncbi:Unknown protein, partial [Striga hermonthica]